MRDFIKEQVPDATTLLHYRYLLEEKGIGKLFFDAANRFLEKCGRLMPGGSIVDVTIISGPSSTKNAAKKRNPEMRQTKKDNEWRFGMKCHTEVDAGTGYFHTVKVSFSNVHDIATAKKLIREDDEVVYGDDGDLDIERRPEIMEDSHKFNIDYRINQRPGTINALKDGPEKDWFHFMEHQKSSGSCKVEHPYQLNKTSSATERWLTVGFIKITIGRI